MRLLTTTLATAVLTLWLAGAAQARHQSIASMVKWGARTNAAVAKIQRLTIQAGSRQLGLESRGHRRLRPVVMLEGQRNVAGRTQPTRLVLNGIKLQVEARGRTGWRRIGTVEGALTAPDLTSRSYDLLVRSFGQRLRARHVKPLGKIMREMTPR